MPFAGYKNFEECVRKNKNKSDPEAYCGSIKHKVEDIMDLLALSDFEDLLIQLQENKDAVIQRGKHARCIDRLQYLGFSEDEAKIMCAALFLQDTKLFGEKHEPTRKELEQFKYRYDPRTRHHGGHPTHVEIGVVPRAMALPLQVPHRPPKSEHSMRTKMERLQTEEEKWLTMEELAKRANYQREIQKTGMGAVGTTKHATMGLYRKDSLIELLDNIQKIFPEMNDEEAIEFAYDNDLLTREDLIYEHNDFVDSMTELIEQGLTQDDAYVATLRKLFKDSNFVYAYNDITLDASKSSLKNARKLPVILAREIVQKYAGENGIEKHYKPFKELAKAVEHIDELPIIIEHKKFNDNDVVGYVKELRADEKDRSIKGFAYLQESKLPTAIIEAMDAGEVIPVSIGFHATMGDSGTFNGEPYDKTQENIILNHLAIVIDTVPRCPPHQCGLNLDSVIDSEEDEKLVLKKKMAQYYYIGDSEDKEMKKEKESKEEERKMEKEKLDAIFAKIMQDQALTDEEEKLLKSHLELIRKEDTTPKWIMDLILHKLDEILPLPIKEDSKMAEEEEKLKELESKIAELEDSLSEKDEIIKDYEEKERKSLIDSIMSVSNKYKEDDFKDMCIAELRVREDAISEFKPSMKKPKKFVKDGDVKEEDSERIDPRFLFQETNKRFK